jgi:hypothetical protein
MIVKVHLYTQSEPVIYDNVKNAYQKGAFYCLMFEGGAVHKFPVQHIFRVTETNSR